MEARTHPATLTRAEKYRPRLTGQAFANLAFDRACEITEWDRRHLRSRRRDKEHTLAIQAVMFMLNRIAGLSTVVTGNLLLRDHSTVIFGVRQIEQDLKHGLRAAAEVEQWIARYIDAMKAFL